MIGSPVAVPGAIIDAHGRERVGRLGLLLDACRAYRGGPAAVAARQRARLAALVDYARTRSPFYRRLYAGLPERVEDPRLLPVTGKAALMDRFDDWVTDPAVTLQQVQAFVAPRPDRTAVPRGPRRLHGGHHFRHHRHPRSVPGRRPRSGGR